MFKNVWNYLKNVVSLLWEEVVLPLLQTPVRICKGTMTAYNWVALRWWATIALMGVLLAATVGTSLSVIPTVIMGWQIGTMIGAVLTHAGDMLSVKNAINECFSDDRFGNIEEAFVEVQPV